MKEKKYNKNKNKIKYRPALENEWMNEWMKQFLNTKKEAFIILRIVTCSTGEYRFRSEFLEESSVGPKSGSHCHKGKEQFSDHGTSRVLESIDFQIQF